MFTHSPLDTFPNRRLSRLLKSNFFQRFEFVCFPSEAFKRVFGRTQPADGRLLTADPPEVSTVSRRLGLSKVL